MNRIWHHHDTWEDHRAGQYALTYTAEASGAQDAAALLGDPERLWGIMSAVVREWPNATGQNLSNSGQNRQAWLGQAACCRELGVPDFVTKQGWHLLTTAQQVAANAVADQVIAEWEASQGPASLWDGPDA